MSKETPNMAERALVKTWSDSKKTEHLKEAARSGRKGWVLYLLEVTNYALYPSMFNRGWWVRGIDQSDRAPQLEIARAVVRYLVDRIDLRSLPLDVVSRVPATETDANRSILRLADYEKYKL